MIDHQESNLDSGYWILKYVPLPQEPVLGFVNPDSTVLQYLVYRYTTMATSHSIPSIKLNDGSSIPVVSIEHSLPTFYSLLCPSFGRNLFLH
jgi:hypothetical protein